ncbi:MAG: hypothetical protein PUI72_02155 [Prevotellaceae bacterium]|nr:hypothetical protein [Prevotellaceae bacterium]MDY6199895.1 hypothetical protein [Prevotella sp.]
MKKIYIKPELEVVQMNHSAAILAGSNQEMDLQYGFGSIFEEYDEEEVEL